MASMVGWSSVESSSSTSTYCMKHLILRMMGRIHQKKKACISNWVCPKSSRIGVTKDILYGSANLFHDARISLCSLSTLTKRCVQYLLIVMRTGMPAVAGGHKNLFDPAAERL